MRALSERQATNCEQARDPVCRCRCGGRLHGANRGDVASLPYGDPHSLKRPCPACKGKGERRMYVGAGEVASYACPKCKGTGII